MTSSMVPRPGGPIVRRPARRTSTAASAAGSAGTRSASPARPPAADRLPAGRSWDRGTGPPGAVARSPRPRLQNGPSAGCALLADSRRPACSASDLLEELAAGELVVVGEDGGADQDALQDLVVIEGGQSGDLPRGGFSGGGPGVEGQPFAGAAQADVGGGQVDPVCGEGAFDDQVGAGELEPVAGGAGQRRE